MSINDEIEVYDSAPVSFVTGETECYDNAIFPNVIRKRELELIEQVLKTEEPKLLLDYGCGGGWLSILLQKWEFNSIGVDVSKSMVKNAKIACPNSDFIICDAMRLPFKDGTFDFVVGISILHHLDINQATAELKRISLIKSTFMFMEPSLLNPLSAFGRKLFPMESHTQGEKPYTPNYLKRALQLAGFKVVRCFSMFFFAFPAARVSKLVNLNPPYLLVRLAYYLEGICEKTPGIKDLNSNIVAIVKTKS